MSQNSMAKEVVLGFFKKSYDGLSRQAMDFSSIAPALKSDRPLDDRELARVIRLAIAAEHDAAHLYELISDSTKDPRVKKTLQNIASEEKIHVGELEKLLSMFDKENDAMVEKGKKEVSEEIL